ncbi:medium chain dehydrogenase/reductase family protein [Hymenobacter terrenus]|uniref:medium chain dehydrogenase/reductase family protein n=1 Tax=Hymenobacter terrenus TaxID=1629124 RepID=UPI0006196E88|nr:medium chain dehydrogenase/reductase family protein [Hymenobacter terrenus]
MKNRRVIISEYGGPDVIRVVDETALPQPLPGEVRIRVEASSAVFTDTIIRRGLYPYLSVKPPFGLGYDAVGVIDELGTDVHDWAIGQRVAALTQIGGNADFVCQPASRLLPVPDELDPAEATSMILSYVTAYQMLHRVAKVQAGQCVLVHSGAGAVGTALVQLARQAGAEVVATASAGKLDLLRANGATAIDHRTADFWAQLRQQAPQGYDAIFDSVSLANFVGSYNLLNAHGTVVTYGAVGPAAEIAKLGAAPAEMVLFMFSLIGETAAVLNAFPDGRSFQSYAINAGIVDHWDWFAADVAHLFELLATHQIKPIIDERLPLSRAAEAHQRIEAGQVRGRLVFDMSL